MLISSPNQFGPVIVFGTVTSSSSLCHCPFGIGHK